MAPEDVAEPRRESLRIRSVDPPGWEPAAERVPAVGDIVYCLEGPAEVVKVLGRTSDGSRLLELRVADRKQPFFAASSNVLVRSGSAEPALDAAPPEKGWETETYVPPARGLRRPEPTED